MINIWNTVPLGYILLSASGDSGGVSDAASNILESPWLDLSGLGIALVVVVMILKGWIIPKSTVEHNNNVANDLSKKSDEMSQHWKEVAQDWRDNFYRERKVSDDLRIALSELVKQGETTKRLNETLNSHIPFPGDEYGAEDVKGEE